MKMPSPRLTSLFPVCVIVILLLTWGLGCSLASDYKREYFGGWKDFDHDGQDTRYELLLGTSLLGFVHLDPKGERVVAGMWVCPYTGGIVFDAGKLDVDHVVPLQWAWVHGASTWSDAKREEFANDPSNLLVVAASVNRAKGSKGPLYWLPPNVSFWELYINIFVTVCQKYDLNVNAQAYLPLIKLSKDCSKGISPVSGEKA